jgi:uncharacterized delta-60 repeat protein
VSTVLAWLKTHAKISTNEKGEKPMKKSARFVLPGLLALGLLFVVDSANAAAGTLDPTFGEGGTVETNFGNVVPSAAVLQSDGKIIVTFATNFELARYFSDGTLDTGFGNGGSVQTVFSGSLAFAEAVAVQPDGKIVVAGQVQNPNFDVFALVRYNSNGSLDARFGSGGRVITSLGFPGVGESVLIQPDGKILLGATVLGGKRQPNRTVLARYNPDGSLDATFGNRGTVSVVAIQGVTKLALLSDGDILALNGGAIAQFSSTGTLRPTVTGGAIVAIGGGGAEAFQSDSRYVLAQAVVVGVARNRDLDTRVVRFTAAGQVDPTFNTQTFDFVGEGGSGNIDTTSAVAIQSDGKVVLSGTHSHAFSNALNVLVRLKSNGTFDSTFGANGIVTNNLPAGTDGLEVVLIQPDGKILTVGTANNFTNLTLARYLAQ